MNARLVSLVAGFFFISLALFVQGLLPMLEPQSRTTKVTRVVRTDLGELKWIEYHATDYTPPEALGRRVYNREGCWYCHSQYVRPVTGETRRWGPVSQAGEYAYDLPHFFSTRRIGPDLTRVGLKYSDEWHLAHFWDPRMVVPDSIMPRFAGLFDGPYKGVRIVTDPAGRRTLEKSRVSADIFDFESKQELRLTPNADGLLFVPERGKYPVIFTPNKEYTGEAVTLVVQNDELRGLIAYVQKLGMNRGNWRDRFEPQLMEASEVSIPRSEEWIEYGREVYGRRCVGCHGKAGDGNGPAATFLYKDRPRNFTLAVFKFRLTPTGSLPNDGDLLRTISRGVRGTAMPPWHELPEKDRLAVIQYIKYELAVDRSDPANPYPFFVTEQPKRPIHVATAPAPSAELVARGKEVWQQAKCWECHGDTGKGDGAKAAELEDDFGFPIPPADLTAGQFKSGPRAEDIFRTLSTGLMGTPMASFEDSFSEPDRWALSYFVLSLSAYTDPLTREPLEISPADRAAINDPKLTAEASKYAYKPRRDDTATASYYGGDAWAAKHGMEVRIPAARTSGATASTPARGRE